MATAHINATAEDFASTVLMPGDPLRAKLIAENYLENAVLVNNVRGVQGYTGTYKGKRVSVLPALFNPIFTSVTAKRLLRRKDRILSVK